MLKLTELCRFCNLSLKQASYSSYWSRCLEHIISITPDEGTKHLKQIKCKAKLDKDGGIATWVYASNSPKFKYQINEMHITQLSHTGNTDTWWKSIKCWNVYGTLYHQEQWQTLLKMIIYYIYSIILINTTSISKEQWNKNLAKLKNGQKLLKNRVKSTVWH